MDTLQALNQVSNGRRDYVTTEEFAESITRSTNTLRKNHCLNGHCYGIRPIKVGGRLLWSVKEIAKLHGATISISDASPSGGLKVAVLFRKLES